ncbi:FMN-dependent alpha-hydroxy acid dehydrogenase [Leucogyrophana mollusca]|uniref:FMN-dependent alpha-hydroxy acid dehydrogenase n=1 Tax=Leucogyrophana mollusca TaxID=85980 RepID=A0ACB8BTZ4_9AGAM|nr:FMN-dependent alpha-hydroxy acid dehydrogenase [Leucogyrophana mollusca]
MTALAPPKDKWVDFLLNIYGSGKPPVMGTVDIKQIEEKAREAMKDHLPAYMYTFGSAGTCSTDAANRKAFDRYKIVPRMLRNGTARKIETTILGVTYPTPIFVAPVGVQGILHADGEIATAGAAAKVGVPYIMSSASSRSIEQVAEVNGPNGHRWYQLYWPRTSEVTLSLLKRAKQNGFTALVITLDTMLLGWRPHDIETAYIPFAYGVGIQVGTSDPVFMARFGLQPKTQVPKFPFDPAEVTAQYAAGDEAAREAVMLGKAWLAEINSGVFRTWEDLAFIRENWEGPIVLKGIQHVADAEKAIELGMDGIVVSNHGGRQVDGAIASLDALDAVCQSQKVLAAQKTGKFAVLFDSGIRTGSDIIKALALGAQGVLIARPFMYSLAIAGQPGVEQILNQLISDFHITLGLSGYSDVNEIIGKREVLTKVDYLL